MNERALAQLAAGRVVAIATESFFGLLADISRPEAIDCLMSLKPRGADKGVPLILPDRASWAALVTELPPAADELGARFWPGPLSIALPAASSVDARVALGGTVAVRIPSPSPALELVQAFGRALTATSANLPGEPPATRDGEVKASFGAAVADGRLLVVDGTAPGGKPSTIIVWNGMGFDVAREGALASAMIFDASRA